MVQNQWYHFGIGAPPILVYFTGDWDVHWGYGVLTHGHIGSACARLTIGLINRDPYLSFGCGHV